MTLLSDIFGQYGLLGILIAIAVFVILRGEFVFRYPRRKD